MLKKPVVLPPVPREIEPEGRDHVQGTIMFVSDDGRVSRRANMYDVEHAVELLRHELHEHVAAAERVDVEARIKSFKAAVRRLSLGLQHGLLKVGKDHHDGGADRWLISGWPFPECPQGQVVSYITSVRDIERIDEVFYGPHWVATIVSLVRAMLVVDGRRRVNQSDALIVPGRKSDLLHRLDLIASGPEGQVRLRTEKDGESPIRDWAGQEWAARQAEREAHKLRLFRVDGPVLYWCIARSDHEALGLCVAEEEKLGNTDTDWHDFVVKEMDPDDASEIRFTDEDEMIETLADAFYHYAIDRTPMVLGCSEWP